MASALVMGFGISIHDTADDAFNGFLKSGMTNQNLLQIVMKMKVLTVIYHQDKYSILKFIAVKFTSILNCNYLKACPNL